LKTRLISFLLLLAALGCSKEPAPLVGCQFTFKGVSYSFSTAICQTVAGVPALQSSSTSTSPLQELILTQGSSTGVITPAYLSFHLNANDPNTFYTATGAAPTINVSGKTWNFSGTLLNTAADAGTISGACNCTN
jgi:hypothetical protein